MLRPIYDRLTDAKITGLLGIAAVDTKSGTLVSKPITYTQAQLSIENLAAGVGEFFGGPVTRDIYQYFNTLTGQNVEHYFHMITTHSKRTTHYFCLVRDEPQIVICFVVKADVQGGRSMMEIKKFMGYED